MSKDRITYSRLATRRLCPRKDWFAYELRWRREETTAPLRMGSAFAVGKEHWRKGVPAEDAIALAVAEYDIIPAWADPHEHEMERQTVTTLLRWYFWRYSNDDLTFLAAEMEFDIPLVNPDTGGTSRTFTMAGKIDAIVRTPDRRVAVYEDKLTGANISPGESYWQRLRFDGQISQYIIGANAIGFPATFVLYDVTRKPTIKPTDVPVLDDDGLKVVLDDATGERATNKTGKPRQTGGEGMTLQTRRMTPAEWEEKLTADIESRVDWYFQRQEIARLEDDLTEFKGEIWSQSQQLIECRKRGWWFRNVAFNTCQYCEFAGPCLSGIEIDPETPPLGFEIKPTDHDELDCVETK